MSVVFLPEGVEPADYIARKKIQLKSMWESIDISDGTHERNELDQIELDNKKHK